MVAAPHPPPPGCLFHRSTAVADGPRTHLSKTRVVDDWACPRRLWTRVFEPDAPELQPSLADRDRMHQGNVVGELATEEFPGGTLIDLPVGEFDARVAATRAALDARAPAIFEASFMEDDVFVAVDILVPEGDGYRIIEVKATTSVKESHQIDAAVQRLTLERAGLNVIGVTLMHLDGDFRKGGSGSLFVQEDITAEVDDLMPEIPALIEGARATLAGPKPEPCVATGAGRPKKCPLEGGCWPDEPGHITDLPGVGPATALKYAARGIMTLDDLPPDESLKPRARRHLEAWSTGELQVAPTLGDALEEFRGRIGFLDFETIMRAIPPWEGLGPYDVVPVQFSYHERGPDGGIDHVEWLASGDEDPRPALAAALLEATDGVERIATYTKYEHRCIRALKRAAPELADRLEGLIDRLVDLQPVVKEHLAHPDFRGSTSIKYVLTPLVPDLTYEGLAVADGMTASVQLASLLTDEGVLSVEETGADRDDLLEYCRLDTLAMVRLLGRLEELATRSEEPTGSGPGVGARYRSSQLGSKRSRSTRRHPIGGRCSGPRHP